MTEYITRKRCSICGGTTLVVDGDKVCPDCEEIFCSDDCFFSADHGCPNPSVTVIPVSDHLTPCDGCNESTRKGYLVYLGRRELEAGHPYDYYCQDCKDKYFPKAIIVE